MQNFIFPCRILFSNFICWDPSVWIHHRKHFRNKHIFGLNRIFQFAVLDNYINFMRLKIKRNYQMFFCSSFSACCFETWHPLSNIEWRLPDINSLVKISGEVNYSWRHIYFGYLYVSIRFVVLSLYYFCDYPTIFHYTLKFLRKKEACDYLKVSKLFLWKSEFAEPLTLLKFDISQHSSKFKVLVLTMLNQVLICRYSTCLRWIISHCKMFISYPEQNLKKNMSLQHTL